MFGRRPDGRRLEDIDPIVQFMPFIMKTRNDASNLINDSVDYEPIAAYIRKRSLEGKKVSFMAVIIGAYVRAMSQYPALNRFIMNKQVFARNRIVVSLTVLRNSKDKENLDEALIKMNFSPDMTLDEVDDIITREVKQGTDADEDNSTVNFASKLVHRRILVQGVVWLARFLDRYGLLPQWLYDVSPFHCSMFITNMASIGMPSLYHHLYNFGNTTIFVAMGRIEKQPVFNKDGVSSKPVIPLRIVTDERVCGGASYTQGFMYFKKLLQNPALLETRPERVVTETPYKN
ncbi:MAG: 2-oxo acid dehydrogenase subunit E2 [Clostridia bacterium]|nr:2-oxo acid dehydrogenase subunit E2 [Clostridia bacterium]